MRSTISTLGLATLLLMGGCAQFNFPMPSPSLGQGNALTTQEIIRGLKEALDLGAKKSGQEASKADGFYKNSSLFIPFPPEAIKVKNTLEKAGIQKPIDDFVLSLNRAAEDASQKAYPIFASAIKEMTITDALAILKGEDNAATAYLKDRTSGELQAEFSPIVRQSIEKVKVTSFWNPIASNYNRLTMLTGGEQVNPNLENYITDKAIDGLFKLIESEEQLIRKDPAARVTELLRKVFAQQ